MQLTTRAHKHTYILTHTYIHTLRNCLWICSCGGSHECHDLQCAENPYCQQPDSDILNRKGKSIRGKELMLNAANTLKKKRVDGCERRRKNEEEEEGGMHHNQSISKTGMGPDPISISIIEPIVGTHTTADGNHVCRWQRRGESDCI
jgi:hypothetical protein